jgi:D-arginine dehydrogenase
LIRKCGVDLKISHNGVNGGIRREFDAARARYSGDFALIHEHDVVVMGAGMAGASVAAHLAKDASVRLLEMEPTPGFHSTGRSAAVFCACYGNDTVRALTRASRDFLHSPHRDFTAADLIKPRAILFVARTDQTEAFSRFLAAAAEADGIEVKTAPEARALHPLLRSDELWRGAYITDAGDIEVHELHQGYLRLLASRRGVLTTRAKVTALERSAGAWSVTTEVGTFRAPIVVNAAGAWADEIGKLAGAISVGLQPRKRTACLLKPPPGYTVQDWPMLADAEEQFYLKPDAGMLLLSPADETPCDPSDVQPDDMDIAIAVDRIERATTLDVTRVTHTWSGIRSFVADRSPVVGYDPAQPGFFWHAALGGYGIQTAPALSRAAAALVMGKSIDEDVLSFGVTEAALSPSRLA